MRLIEIRLTRCRLFLTETELISLLARDPELWKAAIRRGKAIIRARERKQRTGPARPLTYGAAGSSRPPH
ncbi:hypothetical protein [Desulfofundulus salinus]|uniref:Uncharacterized protein n=1 Tax=Desulfofundulus salinus TaxID=2419843 RepID=A0A494WXL9_9FIRM|nr:hypothetical protein [Desulfofundulus salinum]RKO67042.1 hypothetical protein D7024_08810 [Desulfofundulus salinum]